MLSRRTLKLSSNALSDAATVSCAMSGEVLDLEIEEHLQLVVLDRGIVGQLRRDRARPEDDLLAEREPDARQGLGDVEGHLLDRDDQLRQDPEPYHRRQV